MQTSIPIMMGGTLNLDLPGTPCPPDIHEWLVSLGWYSTREHCFSKSASASYCDVRWSEAVVIELYRIVTIGGHQ